MLPNPPWSIEPRMSTAMRPANIIPIWNTSVHITAFIPPWKHTQTIHYTSIHITAFIPPWKHTQTIHYTSIHITAFIPPWKHTQTIHYTSIHITAFIPPWKHTQSIHYTQLPPSHPENTPKQSITHSHLHPALETHPNNTLHIQPHHCLQPALETHPNNTLHTAAFNPPGKHTQTIHYTQQPSSHPGNTPKQYITHPSTSQPSSRPGNTPKQYITHSRLHPTLETHPNNTLYTHPYHILHP